MKSFATRLALATVSLFAVGLLLDRLLFAAVEMGGTRHGDLPLALGWRLLAALLTAATALWVARLSQHRGAALAGRLFLAVWGVGAALVWVEGALFLDLSTAEVAFMALHLTLVAAVVTAIVTPLAGPAPAAAAATRTFGAWGWTWRTLVCAVAYLFLYFAAGMAIYPFVGSYYESAGLLPDPAILPPLQLARGTLYVLFLLPLVRSLVAGRGRTALAVACFVPVTAGVAALLLPNPILPDAIRPYHLVEILVSNWIYGLLIGWLFWAGNRRDPM